MDKINTGDLAYIPSNAMLVKFSKKGYTNAAIAHCFTEKPKIVLVINCDAEKGYEVIYNGDRWYVKKRSIYPINEGDNNVGNFNGNL